MVIFFMVAISFRKSLFKAAFASATNCSSRQAQSHAHTHTHITVLDQPQTGPKLALSKHGVHDDAVRRYLPAVHWYWISVWEHSPFYIRTNLNPLATLTIDTRASTHWQIGLSIPRLPESQKTHICMYSYIHVECRALLTHTSVVCVCRILLTCVRGRSGVTVLVEVVLHVMMTSRLWYAYIDFLRDRHDVYWHYDKTSHLHDLWCHRAHFAF